MKLKCLFGHKWNGCKCEKCGKNRDEQHDWDLCKGICKRCGKSQDNQHLWNGCKCTRCGMSCDEQHDWSGCKCSRCLRLRDEQHKWDDSGRCSICHREIKIEGLTDQSMLLNIAENDILGYRRVEAAKRLADKMLAQKIFSEIAKSTKKFDLRTRMEAIDNITNKIISQKIIANEAKSINTYSRQRDFHTLLEKITDNGLLVDVALNNKLFGYEVFDKISDHKSLIDVAITVSNDSFNITSFVGKITDQAELLNIAQNAKNYNLRLIAVEKLGDKIFAQDIYAEVAKNAKDWRMRSSAAKKLTDKAFAEKVLAECAVEEKEEESNGLSDEYRRYLYNN